MDALKGEMTKKEYLITKRRTLSHPPTLPPTLSQPLSLVTISLPFIWVSVLNNAHSPNSVSRPCLSAGYPWATDTLTNLPHMHATLQYLPFDRLVSPPGFPWQQHCCLSSQGADMGSLSSIPSSSYPTPILSVRFCRTLLHAQAHTHKGMKSMLTKSLGAYQE